MKMLEQAIKYLEQGIAIIPLKPKSKFPLINWKEFQNRRATKKEVNEWFTKYPDANIGIVTGKLSGIAVIDVDSEKAMHLVNEQVMSDAPTVKTGKGYHIYCRQSKGVRNFQKRDDLLGIDLRAEGGYVVAPPSEHESGHIYHWIKGKELSQLELTELPGWLFEKKIVKKIPADLFQGVSEGRRNNKLAKLVGNWLYKGKSFEECVELAVSWNEQNKPPLDESELFRTLKSIHDKHLRRKTSVSSEISDKEKEFSAHFDGLVDIVEHKGKSAFLIIENEKLTVKSCWSDGVKTYHAPPKSKLMWLLPRAEEVLKYYESDNEKQLYDDLYDYHKKISELPNEGYYDLLVAWDFHTYLLEYFRYTPYLYLFAVAERGKSRTGKGMCYVAYRGFRTESINESQIIRMTNDSKTTLFLDMRDLWKNAEKKSIQDILLGRFEKGSKIPRVLHPEKGAFKDMVYYDVFGPTIIATNVKVDEILESRAIEINMPETDKNFENDVEPQSALPLKERLVAFRARHLGKSMPAVRKTVKGRLGDILRPIHQTMLLVNPENEQNFVSFITELDTDRKIERSMSYDAEILSSIAGLEFKVMNGKLSVDDICSQMNDGKSDKFKVSAYSVGRRISAMGIKRTRMSNGSAGIFYDENFINRLLVRYGIERTSEDSENSDLT